ncbi:MAG: hypothetical protein LBT05_10400 [Planctomycetaceae bacterium]|jgi:hypothetical protein|nr:hypothetical protein [Planctomycetaceae bacterium]
MNTENNHNNEKDLFQLLSQNYSEILPPNKETLLLIAWMRRLLHGARDVFDYPADKPDLNGGIHFCLFNNLWRTNYAPWLNGTWTFRFKLEWKKKNE